MKYKYRLTKENNKELIALFDDYQMDRINGKYIILPIQPSIESKQQYEDIIFLLRENYLMLNKLMKHYKLNNKDSFKEDVISINDLNHQ